MGQVLPRNLDLALFFSGAGRYSVRKGIPRWD
jgi:hypothetical protein